MGLPENPKLYCNKILPLPYQRTTPFTMQAEDTLLRYAMIIRPEDHCVLLGDCHNEITGVSDESIKVVHKIMLAKLNPNERKKITSKKVGKWLAMSDDNGLIGIVAVKTDYPERLAYKMINDISMAMSELYGPDDYYKKDAGSVSMDYGDDFRKLIKKYNDPTTFDKLSSANAKVDKAKNKMAANLQMAMENSAALEGLNAKTADLLDAAQDFNKDAEELKNVMASRAARMRIVQIAVGVGGGGVIGMPLIMMMF